MAWMGMSADPHKYTIFYSHCRGLLWALLSNSRILKTDSKGKLTLVSNQLKLIPRMI